MPVKKKPKAKTIKLKLPAKTIDYLKKAGVGHNLLEHKTIYTAVDAANTMKKKMEEIAKSLLVKADNDYYMVLLPADHNLDINKIKKVLSKGKSKEVRVVKIPGESVVRDFLKLKNDAIAAFGSMYKLPVVVEKRLAQVKKAVFSSDSFNHSVEMTVKDFINLEKAVVDSFGIKKKIKKIPAPSKKKPSSKRKIVRKK